MDELLGGPLVPKALVEDVDGHLLRHTRYASL